jgi:archaemetzincin
MSSQKAINYIVIICACLSIPIGYVRSTRDKRINQDKQQVCIIDIQPFHGISKSQVDFIHQELLKLYPHVIVKEAIALPANTYYKARYRYRADSLIKYLRNKTEDGHISIGLTNQDISHTKGTIKDYGIMGLGYLSGRSCIVSTFRLSKDKLLPQFLKLSLHEIGHTQGLPHCDKKTCLMRDAEGKNHFNQLTGFCIMCKKHLENRNWNLNN